MTAADDTLVCGKTGEASPHKSPAPRILPEPRRVAPQDWSEQIVDAMDSRRSGYGWKTGNCEEREGKYGCKKHNLCQMNMIGTEIDEDFPDCPSCSVCELHDKRSEVIVNRRSFLCRRFPIGSGWKDFIYGLTSLVGHKRGNLDPSDNRALTLLRSLRQYAENLEYKDSQLTEEWKECEVRWHDFHHMLYQCGFGREVSIVTIKKMYRKWCLPLFGAGSSSGSKRRFVPGCDFDLDSIKVQREVLTTTRIIKITTSLIDVLEKKALADPNEEFGVHRRGTHYTAFHRSGLVRKSTALSLAENSPSLKRGLTPRSFPVALSSHPRASRHDSSPQISPRTISGRRSTEQLTPRSMDSRASISGRGSTEQFSPRSGGSFVEDQFSPQPQLLSAR